MRGKKMEGFPSRQQVLSDIFAGWIPRREADFVPVSGSLGRITAENIYSKNTLPVYRMSGCDGIAVRAETFSKGFPDYRKWREGRDYVRADTGDDFDDRFDAVIMIEEVDFAEDGTIAYISADITVSPGDNVMPAGCTLKKDELLLASNMPVRPMDMASLAMGGWGMIPVYRKPRVAFVPTGTELVPPVVQPVRGQNVDTNSLMVGALLEEMGAEPIIFPIVPDALRDLEEMLDKALDIADIIVFNAGSAKGEEDFNLRVMKSRGEVLHHYIAAAPGRPMAVGIACGKPLINLPGPTMAAFFGTDWCLRALVCFYLNIPLPMRQKVSCRLQNDIRSTSHMAILCPMLVTRNSKGEREARHISFRKTTMPVALSVNGMYVSDVGECIKRAGETIEVELLRGEEYIGTNEE